MGTPGSNQLSHFWCLFLSWGPLDNKVTQKPSPRWPAFGKPFEVIFVRFLTQPARVNSHKRVDGLLGMQDDIHRDVTDLAELNRIGAIGNFLLVGSKT